MSVDATTPAERSWAAKTIVPVLILLAIMWAAEFLDWVLPIDLDRWGLQSRTLDGLVGIPLAPFVHGDFAHLLANTLPFLVLGTLVAWRTGTHFWAVTITITLVSGLGVWLLGPSNTITIGASSVIFGFLVYLLVAGALTRHWLDILIALAVLLIYGGLLLGALPWAVDEGVSWLGHLMGAIASGLAAFWFSRKPQAKAAIEQSN